MSKAFLMWRHDLADGAVVLKDFTGVAKKFPLHDGLSLAEGFPLDAAFHMHPDHPDDLLLQDSLANSDMCLVVSERLKRAVQALAPPRVEYLPVGIVDHRGRRIREPYYVLHPVDPVDCIDAAASEAEFDTLLDPESIESVQQMVLDEARVPADRQIFRLAHYWGAIVVRREFALALDAGGFTGVRWLEPDAYPEA